MVLYSINDSGGIGPLKPLGTQPRDSAPEKTRSTESQPPASDRAEVAKESRDSAASLDGARLVLETLPEVRDDKLALARKRLAEGYYDRPEVRAEIAGKMAQDPELSAATPVLTPEREQTIRQRLDTGYYQSPEISGQIARGMLEDAGEG